MSVQIQRRRGTAAQHTTFTGAEGEFTYDTTNKRVIAHDGATAGGIPMARADHDHNATETIVTPAGLMRATDVDEALAHLFLRQPVAKTRTETTPPATPTVGDVHIVAAGATGDWATHDDELAVCTAPSPSVAWAFVTPAAEMVLYSEEDHSDHYWTGSAWASTGSSVADGAVTLPKLAAQVAGFVHASNFSHFR